MKLQDLRKSFRESFEFILRIYFLFNLLRFQWYESSRRAQNTEVKFNKL